MEVTESHVIRQLLRTMQFLPRALICDFCDFTRLLFFAEY